MRESEILRGHGENHGRTQVKTGIVEDEKGRGPLLPTHSKKEQVLNKSRTTQYPRSVVKCLRPRSPGRRPRRPRAEGGPGSFISNSRASVRASSRLFVKEDRERAGRVRRRPLRKGRGGCAGGGRGPASPRRSARRPSPAPGLASPRGRRSSSAPHLPPQGSRRLPSGQRCLPRAGSPAAPLSGRPAALCSAPPFLSPLLRPHLP